MILILYVDMYVGCFYMWYVDDIIACVYGRPDPLKNGRAIHNVAFDDEFEIKIRPAGVSKLNQRKHICKCGCRSGSWAVS